MPASHRESYGRRAEDRQSSFPRPARDVGLSTPIGVVQNRHGRVWVADAGNSRLLVFDRDLDRLLGQVGTFGTEPGEFDLPFRLAHHPSQSRLFVTDLGNDKVQELAYGPADDAGVETTVDRVFATDDGAFHPNGVAVHEGGDGLRVFATDELCHTDPTDTRSRVVVFDGNGRQRG